MNLVNRVKDILLKPKDTWALIEGEPATPASLYTQYLMILAAIPAVCSFIGMSLVGLGGFGYSIRIGIVAGLANMVISYVMSLVMVYVLSLIVNALAPTFGGTKNPIAALKLAVYGATAGMVGGVFGIIPMLGILGVFCGLYSIYLIYLGLPVLMKNPPEKSVVYTVVVLLVGFILSLIIGVVSSLVTSVFSPNPYKLGKGGGDATISLKTPDGELKIDTAKIEAAGKQLEAAQKSGDASAAAQAAAGMMGGDPNVLPIPTDAIKLYLLPQMGAFKRTAFNVQSGAAIGLATTTANADYEAGNQRMHLSITDSGGMSSFVRMTGAMVSGEQETDTSKEKTWQENGRTMKQKLRKDGSYAELMIILKNGVMVELKGNQMSLDALRAQAVMLDLNGIENFPRPKKS